MYLFREQWGGPEKGRFGEPLGAKGCRRGASALLLLVGDLAGAFVDEVSGAGSLHQVVLSDWLGLKKAGVLLL